ncbi:hypothetical protein Acr_24g0007640 [Actinidia rufa]|uniref:Uncharacterized protein n=1 Tax=Actinidia rufa TaxID=165716 RepID=A0A7J0GVN6_9ERIC|nr:hypothetical protein Acr_24g0007640 [Actinidia rufa]
MVLLRAQRALIDLTESGLELVLAKFELPESHRSDFGCERKPISNSDQIRSAQKWRLSIPPDSSRRGKALAPNRVKIGRRTSPHAPPEVRRVRSTHHTRARGRRRVPSTRPARARTRPALLPEKCLILTEKPFLLSFLGIPDSSARSVFQRFCFHFGEARRRSDLRALIMLSDADYAPGKLRMKDTEGDEQEDDWADQTMHWTRGRGQKKRPEKRSQEGGHRGQEKRRDKKNCPRNKAQDQSSEAAITAMMAVDESDVLLAASADEESDWISDSGIAYHLCRDKEWRNIQSFQGKQEKLQEKEDWKAIPTEGECPDRRAAVRHSSSGISKMNGRKKQPLHRGTQSKRRKERDRVDAQRQARRRRNESLSLEIRDRDLSSCAHKGGEMESRRLAKRHTLQRTPVRGARHLSEKVQALRFESAVTSEEVELPVEGVLGHNKFNFARIEPRHGTPRTLECTADERGVEGMESHGGGVSKSSRSSAGDDFTLLQLAPTQDAKGGPPSLEGNPSTVTLPPIKKEIITMTQDELDCLRESCSIPSGVQIRLPEVDETIASTCPDEVAFYETAFHAGLRLLIHPTIRRILSLFNLNKNPKPDSRWLYLKARMKKTMLRGDVGVPRVPRSWGTPGKHRNKPYFLSKIEQDSLDGILNSLVEGNLLQSKKFSILSPYLRASNSPPDQCSGGDNAEDKLASGLLARNSLVSRCPTSRPPRRASKHLMPRRRVTCPPVEDKKKGSSSKTPVKSRAMSSMVASRSGTYFSPQGRNLTNPGAILGLKASMLENSTVVKKLFKGMIPPANKEEDEKMDLDREISKFFHIVGQAVVLGSSLTGRELERQLLKLGIREQQIVNELKKTKEDRDATLERFEKEVAELKKKEALIKKLVIEKYKSLDDFYEAVEFVAFRYFGESFDFYKRQISRLHPDLDIQDMRIDAELLEKEEEEEESGDEKEEEKEGKLDNSPAP